MNNIFGMNLFPQKNNQFDTLDQIINKVNKKIEKAFSFYGDLQTFVKDLLVF